MVTEVIAHEGDVVVVEGREQTAHVGGLDPGQVRHEDDRRRRAPRGDLGERVVDDVRERARAAIAQHVSPAQGGEGRHVVAARRDEHSIERARAEDVEDVLEEPLREAGAVLVAQHGAKARLAVQQRLGRNDGPGGPLHRAASAQSARISRARRRRSSRDRMIVEVPSTGIDATVSSSPRSTTIARISPR